MKKQFFLFMFFLIFSLTLSFQGHAENISLSSADEAFLDSYRIHIKEAHSSVCTPSWYHDAYSVFTTVYLDNGLKVSFFSQDYNHIESAESEKKWRDYKYSEKGIYPPGTEVYLEKYYAYEDSLIVQPIRGKVKLKYSKNDSYSNECLDSVFNKLPQIANIELLEILEEKEGWFSNYFTSYYQIKIKLTDNSVWLRDCGWNKPSKLWEEGDRIMVSLNPEGTLLINVDHGNSEKFDDTAISRFKYMGRETE